MSSKLIVKPGPVPVVEPVAYMSDNTGMVFIPKSVKDGGGAYNGGGDFHPANYGNISKKTWDCHVPLYSGTVLEITETVTKEITL